MLTLYLRDSLEDKSILFTYFYLMSGKNQKPGLYLQQAGNNLGLNLQLFCQQVEKTLFEKMNC